jgi:AAA domain-containing protein
VEVSLQQIARALNGEIRGAQVLAPGPGHSTADRSLSVTINASGDDIVVHSFAGDDPIQCKKYVRERCGIQFKPNGNGRADVDLAKLMQEAIASQRREPKGKLIDVFTYRDADGTKLYDVLKYDEPRRYAHRLPDGTFQGSARRVVYRWPELLKFPSTTTYVTEGEKDSNRLWDLGMVATTVASGKWTDTCVEALRGRELLILEDNDEAGRNKALQAARLLYPVANYVKIVRLPDLAHKQDVSDWLDKGHSVEELSDFCNDTPEWEPNPEQQLEQKSEPTEPELPIPTSKILVAYPLIAFADVPFDNQIAYLVQGLLPRSGLGLVWGPKKCGKSFWIMDLALHVALGWQYRGRKVEQVPVVYLALEGQAGYGRRIEAFKQHHNVREAPFYLLRTEVNLVAKVDEIIKNIAQQLSSGPGFIIIDTMNRSLPGSESSDEDMSKYLNAAAKFVKHFCCLVVLVHHPGHDESRPRGHSALP